MLKKWPNIPLKSCGVNTSKWLMYVWPSFNIIHKRIQQTSGFLTGNIEKEQWHEMVGATLHQTCSVRKGFLKISQNSQENTCARVSLIKLILTETLETLAQVFSCASCDILDNIDNIIKVSPRLTAILIGVSLIFSYHITSSNLSVLKSHLSLIS